MLPKRSRVLYLHGFASSPNSRKARFFAEKLREIGLSVEIPDLAQGDFEHLTVTGQLTVVERAALGQPAILIGSSMGGYLAALYAAAHPEIDRLILLAPAFRLHDLWIEQYGPEKLASWRKLGTIPVFHYGEAKSIPLSYRLMEDASRLEPFPNFGQPCLIFHGIHDPLVPFQQSAAFAASHPNVTLTGLQSGHELTDVLDVIWLAARDFLLECERRGQSVATLR